MRLLSIPAHHALRESDRNFQTYGKDFHDMSIMVSIIVPVYNAEHVLNRCVDSLLSQTLSSIEIILVDDGSSDGSRLLCDTLAERHPNIHTYHTPNHGPAAARNKGIAAAKGNFVGFVDADDLADFHLYQRLHTSAEESNSDFVFCDYWQNNQHAQTVCRTFPSESRTFSKEKINTLILPYFFGYGARELNSFAEHCPFADTRSYVWNCLYRRSFLEENQISFPSEKLYYTEDNLFNLLVTFHAKKAAYVATPLYHHIENPSAFTEKFASAYFPSRIRKYTFLQNFIQKNNLFKFADNRLLRKICAEVPTLINYYAASSLSFKQKHKWVRNIVQTPSISEALQKIPSAEWPAGRFRFALILAKHKMVTALIWLCLVQKQWRTLQHR